MAAHDEVLLQAIQAHGGWLFKHTGDDVCVAKWDCTIDATLLGVRVVSRTKRIRGV